MKRKEKTRQDRKRERKEGKMLLASGKFRNMETCLYMQSNWIKEQAHSKIARRQWYAKFKQYFSSVPHEHKR